MLPTSVGRLARPTTSAAYHASISNARVVAGTQYQARSHQRRLSSSKVSRSPDAPNSPETTAPNAATKGVSGGSSKSQDGVKSSRARQGRRTSSQHQDGTAPERASGAKAKDQAFVSLPFVPATNHLQIQDVHTSAFFALDRPISITNPIPPEVSNDAFEAIFKAPAPSKVRNNSEDKRPSSTSHSTAFMRQILQTGQNPYTARDLRSEIQDFVSSGSNRGNAEAFRQDNQSVETIVGRFVPFNPPPPPVPHNHKSTIPSGSGQQKVKKSTSVRQAKPKSKAQEILLQPLPSAAEPAANGALHPNASEGRQPALSSAKRNFLLRMFARHKRLHASGSRSVKQSSDKTMLAISVKRQRRLKMKKHKYKKLMRRTRNLRRREGRN